MCEFTISLVQNEGVEPLQIIPTQVVTFTSPMLLCGELRLLIIIKLEKSPWKLMGFSQYIIEFND